MRWVLWVLHHAAVIVALTALLRVRQGATWLEVLHDPRLLLHPPADLPPSP